MSNNLPKVIRPCPIVEAVVEVRFTTSTHSDEVFGIVYNKIRSIYPEVEELPILQIPDLLRTNNDQFTYQPYYKLSIKMIHV